ncbi:MAG: glutamate 5-kinase [Coriobacteriales bacterium]|nr:glutamate 5-kinase [Coriobacteriales bacterium]
MSERQRIVIKVGTSTLTSAEGRVDTAYIASLMAQVAALRARGDEVTIVSSGAIAAGLELIGDSLNSRPDDIPTLQAAAAVGQVQISGHYAEALAAHGLTMAQVLLTRFEIEHREAYLHARDTLSRLLELGVVPLINENDTVATDEIRFGDNDTLAAQVAILIKADLVCLLSDIEGLYTADPRLDEDAELLREIGSFTEEIVSAAGDAGSSRGSGGMITKLEAARLLMAAGSPMVICEGHAPDAVLAAAAGEQVGTRFGAQNPSRSRARKLWQALSGSVKGSVYVDDGAVHALREGGGSLLPVGVTSVSGSFSAGSVVDIRSNSGLSIGRGLTQYGSDEIRAVAGQRSETLKGGKLLPGLEKTEVIHRDNMVLF